MLGPYSTHPRPQASIVLTSRTSGDAKPNGLYEKSAGLSFSKGKIYSALFFFFFFKEIGW